MMASPSSQKARAPFQQALDPALDFFSPSFDPLRALLSADITPPLPSARPLDTVFHCRFMLPKDHPDAWRDPGRTVKSKVTRAASLAGADPPQASRQCERFRCGFCVALQIHLAGCWFAPRMQEAAEAAAREKSRLTYLQHKREQQQ